ncbi:MAG: hypothetical protein ACRYHQ_24975 [Janthinobacterium lividum]
MKTVIAGVLFSTVLAGAGVQAHAAVATGPVVSNAVDNGSALPVTPIYWAGPNTICHNDYYGRYCHPAYGRGWIPGHYSWRGFWIPGHWF